MDRLRSEPGFQDLLRRMPEREDLEPKVGISGKSLSNTQSMRYAEVQI